MKRIVTLTVMFLTLSLHAFAQSRSIRFPQFVDGKFPDGTYYRSTLLITPGLETDTPTCTVQLYGMTAMLGSITLGSLTFTIPFGGFYATQTPGTIQSFQGGYATVECSSPVNALLLYSFYNSNFVKIVESSALPSNEASGFKMVADHRDGAHLGIAIANNTDAQRTYTISVGSRIATVTIPPRRSLARYLDELISFSNNELAFVTIRSTDASNFSVIGLRYTGVPFTTIPATATSPTN
jgi:hypothetical protein